MNNNYDACILKIYQDFDRFGRWYCKVILGKRESYTNRYSFSSSGKSLEVALSGPGKSKAVKKVKRELFIRGFNNVKVLRNGEYIIEPQK